MSLIDPRSGLPYPFGAKLPSADVNAVWAQQPRALDALQGGAYTLGTGIDWTMNAPLKILAAGSSGILWETGKFPLVEAQVITYQQPLSFTPKDATIWGLASATNNAFPTNIDVSTTDGVQFAINNLPRYGLLKKVRVYLRLIAGATQTGLPGVMPTAVLCHTQQGSGTIVQDAAESDASASFGAFAGMHAIELTVPGSGLDLEVNRFGISLYVQGQALTNAVAGELYIARVEADVEVTQILP